jgi:hypothetical protein
MATRWMSGISTYLTKHDEVDDLFEGNKDEVVWEIFMNYIWNKNK